MNKKVILFSFFVLCFCINSNAQITSKFKNTYTPIKLKQFELKSDSIFSIVMKPSLTRQNYQGIYQSCLGVFCKFENKILKSANVPVRFRLGSTEYVDQLEQKAPSYKDVTRFKSRN